MTFKNILQRYADVRFNERSMVAILFLQSLLLGFSTSYYFVAANTFFIKKANIADIPFAYIIAGIVGIILVAAFKTLLRKFGNITGYIAVLGLFALVCISLYWGHIQFDANPQTSLWVAYAGFIVVFPFASLFVLGFSGICLHLFNLSQSKRLLALIGIGEVVASIIGYLTVPFITKATGNPLYLFLLSAFFIVLSIFPVIKIYQVNKEKFIAIKSAATVRKFSWQLLTKDQFYISLTIVAFFSVLAIYFTDYAYLVSVRNLAQLSGFAVADIIAILFCIIKIGELLFSFFSSNIISTKGMSFSLLLLPFLLLVLSLLAVVTHFVFDDTLIFVIAFFLLAKWSDRVIRKGVYAPSTKVLYQVTNVEERIQLQTSIEGTISQFSIVLSGIILLAVSQWQKNNVDSFFYILSIICLLFSVLWIVFVIALYGGYKKRIHAYLHSIQMVAVTVQKQSIAQAFNHWASMQEAVMSTNVMNLIHEIFDKNFATNNSFTNAQLIELIISYNPALSNVDISDEAMLYKRMIRFYFSNDNFFSRLLIIWYLEQTNQLQRFSLIAELYEASDFLIRKELIAALNRLNYQPQETDKFYFTELCKACVAEIIWAEPAIVDITELEQTNLIGLLEEYIIANKDHLLELLKLLYGKETVHIVQTVLNESDKGAENQIFAVELLDNILTPLQKEIVMPIFEPITQQMRWAKLSKQFLIYHLNAEERLKEILFKNFKLIDINIKIACLKIYYQLTKDDTVLAAFLASHVDELNNQAHQLKTGNLHIEENVKVHTIQQLQLDEFFKKELIAKFTRYGIMVENFTKPTNIANSLFSKKAFEHVVQLVQANKQKVDIDIVGLGMLFKIKYAAEN